MLKIILAPAQAIANIVRFEDELEENGMLQARLAYARAWYAHEDKDGNWCFAPSKFVGYEDMDADTYLQNAEQSDGRRTEAQLQLYFFIVEPTHQLYDELHYALVAFLARYGKTPSMKMRINILRYRGRLRRLGPEPTGAEDNYETVVNSIVAIAKTLPTAHFQKLRGELEELWL